MNKIKPCFVTNTNDINVEKFFEDFKKAANDKFLVITYAESAIATNILKDLGVKTFDKNSIRSIITQLTDICIDTGAFFDVLQDTITVEYEAQTKVPSTTILLIQTKDMDRLKPTLNYVLPNISDDIDPIKSVYLKKTFSKDFETTKKHLGTEFTYKFDLGDSTDSVEKAAATLFELLSADNEK